MKGEGSVTRLIFRVDPAATMRARSAVGAPEPVAVAILAEMGGVETVLKGMTAAVREAAGHPGRP